MSDWSLDNGGDCVFGNDAGRRETTLFDEVRELGHQGGHSTFTRALRRFEVRPHCEPCHGAKGRDVAVITTHRARRSSSTGLSCPLLQDIGHASPVARCPV